MEVVNRHVKKRYILILRSSGWVFEIYLRLIPTGGSPGKPPDGDRSVKAKRWRDEGKDEGVVELKDCFDVTEV